MVESWFVLLEVAGSVLEPGLCDSIHVYIGLAGTSMDGTFDSGDYYNS